MIRRAEHSADKRFFLFARKTAQDKNLSFQATGLLAYVLSKPPGWTAKDSDLMKRGGIKHHALNTILDELKERGYARRVRDRQKDGTFKFFLDIAEEPIFTGESPLPDLSVVDSPLATNQVVAIDSTGASARSSSDLTDLREREPRKRSHKPPEPEIIIDPPYHSKDFMLALTKYETVKKEIKSPLTPTSREALYCKLAKFDEETATLALEEAAAGGYKGVFPNKARPGNGNGNGKYHEQPYTGPVKSKPDPVKENCQVCRGMGTYLKKIDGVDYAFNCNHQGQGVVAA